MWMLSVIYVIEICQEVLKIHLRPYVKHDCHGDDFHVIPPGYRIAGKIRSTLQLLEMYNK
jgi:hypothetical protein